MYLARRQFLALGAAPLLAGPALAQSDKPIRILYGFPAGGGGDIGLRVIAQQMTPLLGQTVMVENKPGADATIAAAEVVRSAPDGSTLFFGSGNSMVAAPLLRGKPTVSYDPFKDFTPIGSLGNFTMVLLVAPGLPVTTLAELVAYVRARPGKLNYASGYSAARLAAIQLLSQYKLDMQHVPYKGESQAHVDLMANRVELMFSTAASARGFVADGKMRPLLVLSNNRSAVMPNVPTLKETGAQISVSPWAGLYGPANMPPAVVDRLNQALRAAMAATEARERFNQLGFEPIPGTPAELVAIHRNEYEVFRKAVQEDGIKFD